MSVADISPPTDPCDLAIRDTFIDPLTGPTKNGVDLGQVLADLTQAFSPLGGGSFGTTGSFLISMDVSGSSPASLIFLNEIDTGVRQAIPAASSFVSIGTGEFGGILRRSRLITVPR